MQNKIQVRCLFLFLIFVSVAGLSFAQPLSGILPKNQSNLDDFNVTFQWNIAPNTLNYKVMVASNNTFTNNYTESPLTNLTTWSSFVPTQGNYFWRVKSYTANDSSLSPTYTFSYFTPGILNSTSLWLKADAGITQDVNNKVQQWTDLSVNGYVMNQNLASKRPVVANNSVNGYPSISFSGAQVLSGGDILDLALSSRAMFVIGKMAASNQSLIAKSKAANATFRYGLIKDVGNTAFLFQSDINTSNYSTFNTTNYALYNAFVNRTTAKNHLDVNNSSLGTSSFNSNLPFESNFRFLIGAYNNANDDGEILYLNGNICEIIFSDTNDSLDIIKIKNYLKYKYTPVFNLGNDITITNGFCPQTLTAPTGFTNYQWNTGATTANIAINQTGAYWVSGYDAFGFKWTDTVFVQFPTISLPPSTSICANSSIQWNTGLGVGFTHTWNTGAIGNNITISQSGTYNVQVTGSGGCPSNIIQATFTLDPYPIIASLGNDTTLCVGNNVSLQIGAQQTNSYSWSNGTSGTSFPITNIGIQVISLTSSNINGCIAQDTLTINVNGMAPTMNLTLPLTYCTNATVQFMNQSTVTLPATISSQIWSFSNGLQLSGNSIETSFPFDGWINGSIEVVASDNCSSQDTFSFYVQNSPDLSIQHNGSCSNDLITFQATDLNGNSLNTYAWEYFGGEIDTNEIGSNLFNQTGLIQIELMASNIYGCMDTIQYTFNLSAAPNSEFTISNTCAKSIVDITNTSISNDTTPIVQSSWDFGNNINATSWEPEIQYPNDGAFICTLVVLAGNGCSDTSFQNIIIQPIPILSWDLSPACKNNPCYFESSSTITSGSIDSTSWMVNLQYPLNGVQNQYTFLTYGIQYLELSAISDQGCTSDTLILVDVHPEINAIISNTPYVLVSGLPVIFSSTSVGNNIQSWYINGNYNNSNPSFSYDLGDSTNGDTISILLIVENSFGCIDSSFTELVIEDKILDLEIVQIFLSEINGQSTVGIELKNQGTILIDSCSLQLKLSELVLFENTWTGNLEPEESQIYVFPSNPMLNTLDQNHIDDWICVQGETKKFESITEINLQNNVQCLLLENQEWALTAPHPNPTDLNSTFSILLSEKMTISIDIVNVQGQIISQITKNQSLEEGTHSFILNLSSVANGTYFIRVNNQFTSIQKPIIKF